MKRARLVTSAMILGVLAWAGAVAAEPKPYAIDLAHSTAQFTIRHFFSKVPGRFNDFAGVIMYDDKNLTASTVDVTIKTASIFTNQERRDNHLRSKDFFWADSFPTLTFKSTKVMPGESGKFKIAGDLTMRGITKPVVLDAEFLGMGPVTIEGRSNGTRVGFEATTTVNRQDFDIRWNKTLDQGGTMLGDDVAINIGVEAILQQPEATQSAAPAAGTKK